MAARVLEGPDALAANGLDRDRIAAIADATVEGVLMVTGGEPNLALNAILAVAASLLAISGGENLEHTVDTACKVLTKFTLSIAANLKQKAN